MSMMPLGGDVDFDTLAFGVPHQNTLAYFQNSINTAIQQTQHVAGNFFQQARVAYDNFYGSQAMQRAKAALRRVGTAFQSDIIQELTTLGQIQFAQTQMRYYIMSHPEIRGYYDRNLTEGYAERWADPQPHVAVEDSDLYLATRDGIVYEDDEGFMCCDLVMRSDVDEPVPDLDHLEQNDILRTQSRVLELMRKGKEDPLSIYGSML